MDPSSLRSAGRGISLTALPSEGYAGEVPDLGDYLIRATQRQRRLWDALWRTPQACAWALEPWRWPTIADLVMYRSRADAKDAPASLATVVRQLREDLGLSASGLLHNGWVIATDQVAAQAATRAQDTEPAAPAASARDRMKVVPGGGGA